MQNSIEKIITKNRAYFLFGLDNAEILIKKGQYSEALVLLNQLATFAWINVTGFFTSWKLESLLHELATKVTPLPPPSKPRETNSRKLKILHVVTMLFDSGGHTQLLFNWIKLDCENDHHIIVTAQLPENLPQKKIKEFGYENLTIISLPESKHSGLENAAELRSIASRYDLIVLHTSPNDIVSVVAFSANNIPPVLFMNHADHIFWIGASVSDIVLQFRENSIAGDKIRRGITQKQIFLPIPVITHCLEKKEEENNEENVRRCKNRLNLSPEKTVLLSTGTEYKFRPNETHNLFETIIPVLDENPAIIFFVAGVFQESAIARSYAHPQILFLGEITMSELEIYEWASDIYIETMPCSSFTALLEAGLKRKPIHLMHEPVEITKIFPDEPSFHYTNSKEAWRIYLKELICNTTFRNTILEQQHLYFRKIYNTTAWKEKIAAVYQTGLSCKHAVISGKPDVFFMDENIQFLYTLHPNTHTVLTPYWMELPWRRQIRFLRFAFCAKTKKLLFRKRDLFFLLLPVKWKPVVGLYRKINCLLKRNKNNGKNSNPCL
jgi:hypothetical protein